MTKSLSHHDMICSSLYQFGFLKGHFSDFELLISSKDPKIDNLTFKLHKIIVLKSKTILDLFDQFGFSLVESSGFDGISVASNGQKNGANMTSKASLVVNDPLVTHSGLGIALGHLYADYSYTLIKEANPKVDILCSTLAASNLLQLPDLLMATANEIKKAVGLETVLDFCNLLKDTDYSVSQDLKDYLFTWLCKVTNVIIENVGLIWGNNEGKGYMLLLSMFTKLPFEWLKSVIESEYFIVPSDMER